MNNPLAFTDPSGYSRIATMRRKQQDNHNEMMDTFASVVAKHGGGDGGKTTETVVRAAPSESTDIGSNEQISKNDNTSTNVDGAGDGGFDEASQNLDLSNYLTAGFSSPQSASTDDSWSFGDPLPQGLVDGVTGFGDGVFNAITFGYGDLSEIRSAFGINGGVNKNSDLYSGGHLAGAINGGAALGGAIGLLGKGVKGFEYSHFVPQRFLNKFGITRKWKSPLNGTYGPKLFHALTDKFRYRFMPRTFKAQYGLTSPIPQ